MKEIQEIWVQFLGREDPLEKEMAIHSTILTWKIPWAEEPRGPVHGAAKSVSRHIHITHLCLFYILRLQRLFGGLGMSSSLFSFRSWGKLRL